MKRAYLDFAAAAPVCAAAKRAFIAALSAYGNPSSPHEEGRAAKKILEDARRDIARMAGTKPEAVIFTSGATESNALALRGFARANPHARFAYSPGAHASVARAMERLKEEGSHVVEVPTLEGKLDMETLVGELGEGPALVSLEAIAPETGMRLDTRRAAQALHDAAPHGRTSYLHVDASQLPFVESFERTRLGADLLTLDAQKVGGIRGIGCLIAGANVPLAPFTDGGGQERELRPGTPSLALAAAFAAALAEAAKTREAFAKNAAKEREALLTRIQGVLPNVIVNEGKQNAPHIVNLSFPGLDTDYLVALLDERGFAVATRSACESDSLEGSRAVLALTGDGARAKATLRISWAPSIAPAVLRRFADALIASVRFLEGNTV